ncbi:MAG TPA: hypothetical protein VK879_06695 [Candidatus Sulfomarinibacteraceae bacterium]|nr:hypothetical protein [Candidatus Sulfomarinibacteraceae bacterium]
MSNNNASPISCDLTVLDTAQRESHEQVGRRLFANVQAVQELEDGYAFRFAPDTDIIVDLGRFVAFERQCCPFFDFAIEAPREHGPVTLRLSGREGVKAYLVEELVAQLDLNKV